MACANLALISGSLFGLLAMLEITPILLPCTTQPHCEVLKCVRSNLIRNCCTTFCQQQKGPVLSLLSASQPGRAYMLNGDDIDLYKNMTSLETHMSTVVC